VRWACGGGGVGGVKGGGGTCVQARRCGVCLSVFLFANEVVEKAHLAQPRRPFQYSPFINPNLYLGTPCALVKLVE
jgi:hypothetical protein